jgi:hypothetical protein
MPLAVAALFRRTVVRDVRTKAPATSRDPATIDTDMAAMLNVWGLGQ